jgi:hypothetical protein
MIDGEFSTCEASSNLFTSLKLFPTDFIDVSMERRKKFLQKNFKKP